MNTELQEAKKELRELKREMKQRGIRRISFMNAGLTRDESNFNCRIFQLTTKIKELEKACN